VTDEGLSETSSHHAAYKNFTAFVKTYFQATKNIQKTQNMYEYYQQKEPHIKI
jgi:hypothetical protein